MSAARRTRLGERRWDVTSVAADLVRLDTYERSLGEEWRGVVVLTAEEARRMAADLVRVAQRAEDVAKASKR